MFLINPAKMHRVSEQDALPGRAEPMPVTEPHFLFGIDLQAPTPEGMEAALFGMGCFWGAERLFWRQEGVWLTMVGYAGGYTPNPTYQETCTQQTGHNEVVRVIYDPAVIGYAALLKRFWEGHDPTQGMRQGNDVGTTYRSGVYYYTAAQETAARASQAVYAEALTRAGKGAITTEILPAPVFYYAETYHQQYLAKHPDGYCGLGGTGVSCPIGLASAG